ncbi:MAG: 4-(cytidine 5'-diphospho)-2-C-methyl-D-erythritol kinase [Candidatus Omnitrophica bacterium]|nr:4-(cytidine 5'-diphospho)-2-C-methyl-D-erythritol kinase [Candidatus Omnitrophota bacterium]
MVFNSYAKLNLYLDILDKRDDGYHNILTLFERIDLYDTISLKPRSDKKIKIFCNCPLISKDSTNLAYKSAQILQDRFGVKRGIDIKITKRIPVGSGLGGGSSNAAAVLLGLNQLWRLGLEKEKLVDLARSIGSDVPFFIYNTPFALGTQRGDRLKALRRLDRIRLWHILIVPNRVIPTEMVYRRWDSKRFKRLTKIKYDVKLLYLALQQKNLDLIARYLFNCLEEITSSFYPILNYIKHRLTDLGLKSVLMSGSGPAMFGIVSSRKEGEFLSRQLKQEFKDSRIFLVRTI